MDAPSAILAAAVALCALPGLAFLVASSRRFAVGRLAAGMSNGVAALIFFLAAAVAVLLGANLRTYDRLTAERPVLRASFARAGERQFNATLTYPSGTVQGYVLRGDEWQIGVDALYGSAAYVPMTDGAAYEVAVSQSGLLARPLNGEARLAVGAWH